ncbi:MAG: hypothetical protein HYU63_04465 [Armatimonadetes bacterium]|nr:hypothetical protein [Armatimonadota bacterium]
MPVWKFHSVEEMIKQNNYSKKNNSLRIHELFSLLSSILPPLCKRGVQKFHSIEDANEARKLCEIERARFMKKIN